MFMNDDGVGFDVRSIFSNRRPEVATINSWLTKKTSANAALTVDLDMGSNTGRKLFEVYAGSNISTTCSVYVGDSFDDLILVDEISVPANDNTQQDYETSYDCVRIVIAGAGSHDGRIKAGR
jgi:hypothetical protein